MKVRRDNKLNAFNVKIGYEELNRAFISANHMLIFMHTLTALTLGEEDANTFFPLIKKGDNDEDIRKV